MTENFKSQNSAQNSTQNSTQNSAQNYTYSQNNLQNGINKNKEFAREMANCGLSCGAPPLNPEEFYSNSFLEVILKSIGYFAKCEFLIGTQTLTEKTGIIWAAGVNFITLYNPRDNSYTVCDLYSIKFVTIFSSTPPLIIGK